MKPWQFTVLFLVGVSGAVAMLVAGAVGVDIPATAYTGVGTILAFVLARRDTFTSHDRDRARDHGRHTD